MMKLIALWISLLAVAIGSVSPGPRQPRADTATTRPTDRAVQYRRITRQDPPVQLHVVTVALTDPRVRLHVSPGGADPDGDGPWQTTLMTVREIAQRDGLHVAVNANFFNCRDAVAFAGRRIPYFTGNWASVQGWAMTDGRLWSSTFGGECHVTIDKHNAMRFGQFRPNLPQDAIQALGGAELIVTDGRITAMARDRAPRTSIGVDRAGTTLVMLVVDGRRDNYSVGMTGRELAEAMIELGCAWAINLDGGGSSTMVLRAGNGVGQGAGEPRLMNRPSDGHDLPISLSLERPVACVFGVKIVEGEADK